MKKDEGLLEQDSPIGIILFVLFCLLCAIIVVYYAFPDIKESDPILLSDLKVGSTIKANGIDMKFPDRNFNETIAVPEGEWEVVTQEIKALKDDKFFIKNVSSFALVLRNKNPESALETLKISTQNTSNDAEKNKNTFTLKESRHRTISFNYVLGIKNGYGENKMEQWLNLNSELIKNYYEGYSITFTAMN